MEFKSFERIVLVKQVSQLRNDLLRLLLQVRSEFRIWNLVASKINEGDEGYVGLPKRIDVRGAIKLCQIVRKLSVPVSDFDWKGIGASEVNAKDGAIGVVGKEWVGNETVSGDFLAHCLHAGFGEKFTCVGQCA
jgi:hypothetical protein